MPCFRLRLGMETRSPERHRDHSGLTCSAEGGSGVVDQEYRRAEADFTPERRRDLTDVALRDWSHNGRGPPQE